MSGIKKVEVPIIKKWDFMTASMFYKIVKRFVWKKLLENKALLLQQYFQYSSCKFSEYLNCRTHFGIFDMLFPFLAFLKLLPIIQFFKRKNLVTWPQLQRAFFRFFSHSVEMKRCTGLNYFKQNCPIFRFAIQTFLTGWVEYFSPLYRFISFWSFLLLGSVCRLCFVF